MLKNFPILMGYDDRGTVFDAGDFVLREPCKDYRNEIKKVYDFYQKYNLGSYGIVNTELAPEFGENVLKHSKHTITYPYEWSANMFKKALLFHLELFQELDQFGLSLKDAHPHNILFEGVNPILVDFTSLVSTDSLRTEQSLIDFAGSAQDPRFKKDPRWIVFDVMFFSQFIVPFILMHRNAYKEARDMICYRGCNNSSNLPSWKDLKNTYGSKKNLSVSWENFYFKCFLRIKKKLKFVDFCKSIGNFVKNIDVTPQQSFYDDYYEKKEENYSFEDGTNWKQKQKSVFSVIQKNNPKTVLDIGANTGWFSMLVAHNGAAVISTDVEESVVDLLFQKACKQGLNIIPLVLSFEDFSKEIYGSYDERLAFKDPKSNPIFLAGHRRLNSDLVLCLALLHHLILGVGLNVKNVFKTLANLTKNILIVEFVGLDDSLINLHPSSFAKNRKEYSLEKFIEASSIYFNTFEILPSSPDTRKILVFSDKK